MSGEMRLEDERVLVTHVGDSMGPPAVALSRGRGLGPLGPTNLGQWALLGGARGVPEPNIESIVEAVDLPALPLPIECQSKHGAVR